MFLGVQHGVVLGAMAGYTGFTVGPVNSKHAYIPIAVSGSFHYSCLYSIQLNYFYC